MVSEKDIREMVRERYAKRVKEVVSGSKSCCGSAQEEKCEISKDLYDASQLEGIPKEALTASLGCGNPTALASLKPGEVVLDLGSGGGIDVLLSAKRVGPEGKVYGLDMTDEMLELARKNQEKAGVKNVEFLKGEMEDMPLPDGSVDVIISNCVVNLSPNKDAVLREAFRVLKPGGRFAVSDVVVEGGIPEEVRKSLEAWAGCIAGALGDKEYREKMESAGFEDVQIEVLRVHDTDKIVEDYLGAGACEAAKNLNFSGRIVSAFIRGRKPE